MAHDGWVKAWHDLTLLEKLSAVLWGYDQSYGRKRDVYDSVAAEIHRLETELAAERAYCGICRG